MQKDKTQTTPEDAVPSDLLFIDDARELADRINRYAVKFDKASGSRFLNEEIASAFIQEFLHEFAIRISDATRIRQTQEIMACQTPKQ